MPEKLVRDNIPAIIEANGESATIRTLSEQEFLAALDEKLKEEVAEYLEANDTDELADVLEVVFAIARARDLSLEALESIRSEKLARRGGFENRISLIS